MQSQESFIIHDYTPKMIIYTEWKCGPCDRACDRPLRSTHFREVYVPIVQFGLNLQFWILRVKNELGEIVSQCWAELWITNYGNETVEKLSYLQSDNK